MSGPQSVKKTIKETRNSLTRALILGFPDLTAAGRSFILDTDPSERGNGVALFQIGSDIQKHVVPYMSDYLSNPERNCYTTKKGAGALVIYVMFSDSS